MKLYQFFTIFCVIAIAGCSGDDPQTNRVAVKVIDGYGEGIENATVAIGNRSGDLISYATTDEIGEAHFSSLPLNATVTAAFNCYNSSYKTTYYYNEENIKGYGFALDQSIVDGSVIDIVIDRTDLVQLTHSLVNVPLDTVSYSAFVSLLRKHSATNLPYNFSGNTAPVPATIITYSFDGFSDGNEFGASLTLDQDSDGNSDGKVGFDRYVQDASDQVYDFSTKKFHLTFIPLHYIKSGDLSVVPRSC